MKLHNILKIFFQDYLKKEYYKELESLNKDVLIRDEIKKFLEKIFDEKELCMNYIFDCLEKIEDEYPKKKVQIIMDEMIEDSELLINRIIVEIENQQESLKNYINFQNIIY